MASLILGAAGSAAGAALGSFSLFGATIAGAQMGGAIGAYLGMQIDAALMPSIHRQGARLSDVSIQSSSEGAPVPRVWGRMRLSGEVIWASRFKETSSVVHTGGKGMPSRSVATTEYTYSISFAVGLCAGPVNRIARIWADGNPLDLTRYTFRVYTGDEAQAPDPLIEEIEGAGNTPAYRGLAYLVFEDMPLAEFGNRIPQLQVEVIRSLAADPAALENRLTAVALIPGAGEFVYAPEVVSEDDGMGKTAPLNAVSGGPDFSASLDELLSLAPDLKSVSLVVGWFGDDLRAGAIRIRPGVEEAVRNTYPETWSVAGVAREAAYVVSRAKERPAYGGTPSDDSVKAAIAALKARGLAVTFYPFVFMDIAAGNTLANPSSPNGAATGQPSYPWRGRIAVSPAPGFAGSVDQTAAAAAQVNAFFASEWGFRRMVLHYARLCADAGGVESFIIGSELVGLTRTRSDAATYPAVAALIKLAADVRAILPAAKIGYAADWSEYACHQTCNGDVRYPLDALWSDPNIDFIGIDNYMPLADWRDGEDHRDGAEFASIYDSGYLAANIRGGEGYDWYYASDTDRAQQRRTAITDGLGKPWVWRSKDIWSWWANAHRERTNGAENPSPTAWLPESKPIRFTELGCPAVDKGANQPNVFFDPKSSESVLPYFSSGARDDLIQRRFLEAHLNYWRDPANNPVSGVYHAPMLDADHTTVWCWDCRPYPFFPARDDIWGDAGNYPTGHWLNGRLGDVPLGGLVGALCGEAGFAAIDVSRLCGMVTGYTEADVQSVRDALGPLMAAYFFDAVETQGVIRFVPRGENEALPLADSDLVLGEDPAFTRAEESDLPLASSVSYIDAGDYREAAVQSRRLATGSDRIARSALPLVLDAPAAAGISDKLLQDAWTMRESAKFSLPPSRLALDPGDEIVLAAGGRTRRLRLTEIDDGAARAMTAVATDPSLYETQTGAARSVRSIAPLRQTGRALVEFLDVPLLRDTQDANGPLVAAYADPWPGEVDVFKDGALNARLNIAATLGETVEPLWSGPLERWDRVNTLTVRLYAGTLTSAPATDVFGGANALAIKNPSGLWEILEFATAELIAPSTYRLTRLLRGLKGSEKAMADPVPAGARVVVLDRALGQLALSTGEGLTPHTYMYGPAGKPFGDPALRQVSLAFSGEALKPLSPCHVRFAWTASGDLNLSWKRRDRAPAAANLALAECPQSDPLSFDLEILSNGAVQRCAGTLPQTSFTYTVAMQTADFPSGLPNPLAVTVYQRSAVVGRGHGKTENLFIR